MCKNKGDGLRCETHAREELAKNTERLERDYRITRNGQTLTAEEHVERQSLESEAERSGLSKEDTKRLSYLRRVEADDSRLTATEERFMQQNLERREVLQASLNLEAVAKGATKTKHLGLTRGDVIYQAVKQGFARGHVHKQTIENFLRRRKDDPDTPLSDAEARIADLFVAAHPDKFTGIFVPLGNGQMKPLTADAYDALVDTVARYDALKPSNAPIAERDSYRFVQDLRAQDEAAYIAVRALAPDDPRLDEIKAVAAKLWASGKLRPSVHAHAVVHDRRTYYYASLADAAAAERPNLYKAAYDREEMDAARALLPFNRSKPTSADLIVRKRGLDRMTERLQAKDYASFTNSELLLAPVRSVQGKQGTTSTRPVDSSAAALTESAKNLNANKPKSDAPRKTEAELGLGRKQSTPSAAPLPSVATSQVKSHTSVEKPAPVKAAPNATPPAPMKSAPIAPPPVVHAPPTRTKSLLLPPSLTSPATPRAAMLPAPAQKRVQPLPPLPLPPLPPLQALIIPARFSRREAAPEEADSVVGGAEEATRIRQAAVPTAA